jgi:hypothetical protein
MSRVIVVDQSRGPHDSIEQSYCSCLFKNRGRRNAYNEYAVCTSSVFNRRGLRGPGSSVSCKYTGNYLNGLSYRELANFALAKEIVFPGQTPPSREDLQAMVVSWMRARGEYAETKLDNYDQDLYGLEADEEYLEDKIEGVVGENRQV